MGNIEDFRKLIQDFITPDLKVLRARLEALEEKMDQRFNSSEEVAKIRHESQLAAMAANLATIMGTLEMEKRLSKLETLQIGHQ